MEENKIIGFRIALRLKGDIAEHCRLKCDAKWVIDNRDEAKCRLTEWRGDALSTTEVFDELILSSSALNLLVLNRSERAKNVVAKPAAQPKITFLLHQHYDKLTTRAVVIVRSMRECE